MTQQQRTPTTRVNKTQMDYAAGRLREMKQNAISAIKPIIVTPDEYFDCLKPTPLKRRDEFVTLSLKGDLLPVEVQVKLDEYGAKIKHIEDLYQAARDSIYIGDNLADVLEDFKRSIGGVCGV